MRRRFPAHSSQFCHAVISGLRCAGKNGYAVSRKPIINNMNPLLSTFLTAGAVRPGYFARANVMDTPTQKRKNGNTRSHGVQPLHDA